MSSCANRIRQEKNGGAWCPKAQISSDIREYLEVDLTKDHLIMWTETQGRFGNGEGQEYAESFFLEYWRDFKWHSYKNLRGDRVSVYDFPFATLRYDAILTLTTYTQSMLYNTLLYTLNFSSLALYFTLSLFLSLCSRSFAPLV